MEYFAPINQQVANTQKAIFKESSLFGTCSQLDNEFQKYCYYSTPIFYWPVSIINDPIKAESYCLTVVDPLNQKMCFVGIGVKLTNMSNFDLINSSNKCLEMKNKRNQISCLAGVKWNAGPSKENANIAKDLCLRLGQEANLECEAIAKKLNN